MDTEFVLVIMLIAIFIASFCGLLRKIRKSYEDDERAQAESYSRVNGHRRGNSSPTISFTEVYVNPSYTPDRENSTNQQGVFPGAPPPYTELYNEPPPSYEDIFKAQARSVSTSTGSSATLEV